MAVYEESVTLDFGELAARRRAPSPRPWFVVAVALATAAAGAILGAWL